MDLSAVVEIRRLAKDAHWRFAASTGEDLTAADMTGGRGFVTVSGRGRVILRSEVILLQLYRFVTQWTFTAPVELVWEEVIDARAWPTWTKDLRKIDLRGPEPGLALGSVADCEVKGALPYSLRYSFEVVGLEPLRRLEMRAWGDLVGTGRWILEPHGGGTATTFSWDVGTTNRILNLVARLPFVRSLMERNHDNVMAAAYRGLLRRLERRSVPEAPGASDG